MCKRLALLAACLAAACTEHVPANRWWESPTQPTSPPATLAGLALDPRALNGGAATQGTVTLNLPAPAATTITLSSNNPSVVVPGSVTVPAGATTATFNVSTSVVSSDGEANLTASVAGSSLRTTLLLWAIVLNSFWYESTPGEGIGGGGAAHYTDANARLTAACDQSNLYVQVTQFPGDSWNVIFAADRGTPLRPGTYEFSPPFNPLRKGLSLSGLGRGCQTSGQFVIETADFNTDGTVRRFVATFAQRCDGNPAVLRGELRLANPPLGAGGGSPRRCLQ